MTCFILQPADVSRHPCRPQNHTPLLTLMLCRLNTIVNDKLYLDLFTNQYLFQKIQKLLSPTLENHEHPIDSHCKNFNSLILSYHTWNMPKKYPSRIFTACRWEGLHKVQNRGNQWPTKWTLVQQKFLKKWRDPSWYTLTKPFLYILVFWFVKVGKSTPIGRSMFVFV